MYLSRTFYARLCQINCNDAHADVHAVSQRTPGLILMIESDPNDLQVNFPQLVGAESAPNYHRHDIEIKNSRLPLTLDSRAFFKRKYVIFFFEKSISLI